MTKSRNGGHDKPGRKALAGAEHPVNVRRAVAGLQDLQKQIRRRSRARLSNEAVRSAINEGRP